MGFWSVERNSGVFLIGELGVESVGESFFDLGVFWIVGEVGQFVAILRGVIEFFGRTMEKAFDELAGAGLLGGSPKPGRQ